MGEAKRGKSATANHAQPVMICDPPARFANSELAGLAGNYGVGDILSGSIRRVWCDPEDKVMAAIMWREFDLDVIEFVNLDSEVEWVLVGDGDWLTASTVDNG